MLHIDPVRWDELGWHHQRALIEGLEDEEVVTRNEHDGGVPRSDGTTFYDLAGADDAVYKSLGATVEIR